MIFKFNKKILVATLLLCIYYYLSPIIFIDEIYTIPFYAEYIAGDGLYVIQIFSALLVAIGIIVTTKKTGMLLAEFKKNAKVKSLNKIISNSSVFVMCLSSLPLVNGIANGFSDRAEAYAFILDIRQNVILSVIFSIALVSSVIEFTDGRKRNITILTIFAVLPELIFGTRISAFRVFFLALIFFPWNFRYFIFGLSGILFIGMSRALFTGYSSDSYVDFLVLFFGDPLNIFYGTSLLYNSAGLSCGLDGLHFLRIVLPPVGVRDLLNEYIGDVTVCVNASDFGGMGTFGLGGSLPNDILAAPLSAAMFYLFFLGFSKVAWARRISPLLQLYIPVLILSCAPYIMRNGLIATVNHMATVIIWVLIPIFLLINLFKFYGKRRVYNPAMSSR